MIKKNVQRLGVIYLIIAFCCSLIFNCTTYFARQSHFEDLDKLQAQKELLSKDFHALEEMDNYSMVLKEDGYEVSLKTSNVTLICLFDKDYTLKQSRAQSILILDHDYHAMLIVGNLAIVVGFVICSLLIFYLENPSSNKEANYLLSRKNYKS